MYICPYDVGGTAEVQDDGGPLMMHTDAENTQYRFQKIRERISNSIKNRKPVVNLPSIVHHQVIQIGTCMYTLPYIHAFLLFFV